MNITIEEIQSIQDIPLNILLLADPSVAMINDYLSRGICYGAKESGMIVGVLVILKTRPKTMEIMNIAVLEAYQHKGIGRKLIDQAIDRAKMEKINTLEIGTGNSSVMQLLFYQKCGFRITGIDFDYFRIHYQEKLIENGIECRDMIRLRMELNK